MKTKGKLSYPPGAGVMSQNVMGCAAAAVAIPRCLGTAFDGSDLTVLVRQNRPDEHPIAREVCRVNISYQ